MIFLVGHDQRSYAIFVNQITCFFPHENRIRDDEPKTYIRLSCGHVIGTLLTFDQLKRQITGED